MELMKNYIGMGRVKNSEREKEEERERETKQDIRKESY